jgi:DNA modification methylase
MTSPPYWISVGEKSLCLVPFRFALEMINRNWILRNVIVWHKPNCMPSSAKDRFTIDFEFLFFFTKSKKYFFEPQFEPHSEVTKKRVQRFVENGERFNPNKHKHAPSPIQNPYEVSGRNKRCVWSIPTQGFLGSHYATYPEALCEIPIKAGCPEAVCTICGTPRKRIIPAVSTSPSRPAHNGHQRDGNQPGCEPVRFTGCRCQAPFAPGIVLDPFLGAGTTALVALKLNRQFIGIELNPKYIELAKKRLSAFQHLRSGGP